MAPNKNIQSAKRWLALLAWIIASFSAGGIGAFFMPGAWYDALNKPSWNPPGWIFGPVWSALYAMMAVSAWLIWQRGGFPKQSKPLLWFSVQLLLNALWSPLFFGLHQPGIAFGEILLLWGGIAGTMRAFYPVSRKAVYLLIPYLAWVSFAAVLNFAIWRLNP